MKNLQISENLLGTRCECNILGDVVVLTQNAGAGKTYFITLVKAYMRNRGIDFCHVDYHNYRYIDRVFQESFENAEIVLLDNLDIYCTEELSQKIVNSNKLCIICMHNFTDYNWGKYKVYHIEYEGDTLFVKEGI